MKIKCPNLRLSETPSNKFQLAYFYLSESIKKARFNMRQPVAAIFFNEKEWETVTWNHSIRIMSKAIVC